jgi:hypothetical protein
MMTKMPPRETKKMMLSTPGKIEFVVPPGDAVSDVEDVAVVVTDGISTAGDDISRLVLDTNASDVEVLSVDADVLSVNVDLLSVDVGMLSVNVDLLSVDVGMLSVDADVLSVDVDLLLAEVDVDVIEQEMSSPGVVLTKPAGQAAQVP